MVELMGEFCSLKMNAFAGAIVRGIWPNGNHLSAVLWPRGCFWLACRIFHKADFSNRANAPMSMTHELSHLRVKRMTRIFICKHALCVHAP